MSTDRELLERAAEIAYDHLDDAFLSGHGYATGVSEGND